MTNDTNRMKAELTFVCKDSFDLDLASRMGQFFPDIGADIAHSVDRTSLGMSPGMLKSVFFARDLDVNVLLYLREDHSTMKIHLERTFATTLEDVEKDLLVLQSHATEEVERIQRFCKKNGYKIKTVKAIISLGEKPVFKAQQKVMSQRIRDGLKTAALVSKASAVIATGVAAMVLQMDAVSAGKALLAGLFTIAISTIVEAGMGDAFKFERS